jgi:hypothetical protein
VIFSYMPLPTKWPVFITPNKAFHGTHRIEPP